MHPDDHEPDAGDSDHKSQSGDRRSEGRAVPVVPYLEAIDPGDMGHLSTLFGKRAAEVLREDEDLGGIDWDPDLDFSPKSLGVFEFLLMNIWIEDPKLNHPTSVTAGAYLGEVITRNLGGRWESSPQLEEFKIVDLPGGRPSVRPFEIVATLWEEGPEGLQLGEGLHEGEVLHAWYTNLEGSRGNLRPR